MATSSAPYRLQVTFEGLFGVYMPPKSPDAQKMISYDPFYVIAPRGTDPSENVGVPQGQKTTFQAAWLPPHVTALQFPLKNLADYAGGETNDLVTMILGVRRMHTDDVARPSTVSLVEFPCDDAARGPVTLSSDAEALIPIVMRAGDPNRPATLDPDIIKNPSKTAPSVSARLMFTCRETLTVQPPHEHEGKPITVQLAYLEKTGRESGPGAWTSQIVSTSGVPRGGKLVFTRTGQGVARVQLNGSTFLTLKPDSSGTITVAVRTLPTDEILGHRGPRLDYRMDLEHFRLLYGLAIADDKKNPPYYYYAWRPRNPPAGSRFCDNAGRFTQ